MNLQIGKTIKSIRLEKELKQVELARLCNISKSYLSEIESNKKKPDLEILEDICNALKVPIHVFMFKAINENEINEPGKKRLVREIKPLINKIAEALYSDSFESKLIELNL